MALVFCCLNGEVSLYYVTVCVKPWTVRTISLSVSLLSVSQDSVEDLEGCAGVAPLFSLLILLM